MRYGQTFESWFVRELKITVFCIGPAAVGSIGDGLSTGRLVGYPIFDLSLVCRKDSMHTS